jgi:CRISPR-associated protein Cas5d
MKGGLMTYGVKVEVWGDYALFSRPELSVERMSYDVMTPSAARGILESIYWHPGMKYVVEKIHVLNQIQFTNIRRNEVKSKVQASALKSVMVKGGELPHLYTKEDIAQRAACMLRDVRYVIEAHFEMTEAAKPEDNPGKFIDILRRRLRKGECYSQPYLGTRECACHFRDASTPEVINAGFYENVSEKDFGLMLFDMDYSNQKNIVPMFFRAVMKNGVIDVAASEVFK